jgi:hypothetical protein
MKYRPRARVEVDLGAQNQSLPHCLGSFTGSAPPGTFSHVGEVGGAVDAEVVAGVGAVGRVGVVVAAALVVQDVGVGGREGRVVEVGRVRARAVGGMRLGAEGHHREAEQHGDAEQDTLRHGDPPGGTSDRDERAIPAGHEPTPAPFDRERTISAR